MTYMITLGLIALLSLKVAIGSIRLLEGTGEDLVQYAWLAVTACTVLSLSLVLMCGLYLFQVPK